MVPPMSARRKTLVLIAVAVLVLVALVALNLSNVRSIGPLTSSGPSRIDVESSLPAAGVLHNAAITLGEGGR